MKELKEMLEYTGVNVDRLVEDYTNTLHTYNHPEARTEASIIALKEWARKKEYLIRLIMKMPEYNGNFQSVRTLEVPFERKSNQTCMAIDNIWIMLFDSGTKLISTKNDDGDSIGEVICKKMKNTPSIIKINDLLSYSEKTVSADEFDRMGYSLNSVKNRNNAHSLIHEFTYYTSSRISSEMAERLNKINPKIQATEGMKTTRALGKIIKLYGLEDKSAGSDYGRYFITQYCELMREGGRKMDYVISVNPIDYLKMSIGPWSSCHSIRSNGGWQSGTISYMLDGVTMITYAINPGSVTKPDVNTGEVFLGKDRPELFDKIFRNVFHWDEGHRLIQSRVYPQGNEGAADLYSTFRHEVQKRISEAEGWDSNNWTLRHRKFMDFTRASEGATNYPDWEYPKYGGNLSTPGRSSDLYSSETMYIGVTPLCVKCGRPHRRSNRLTCGECF